MKSTKQLGIWMDHAIAHQMELTKGVIVLNTGDSQLTLQAGELNVDENERLIRGKEQNQFSVFFKKLSDVIKDCKEVVLFGPTDAINGLLNLLRDNRNFEKIKFEVKAADKMTENQEHAFVKVRNILIQPGKCSKIFKNNLLPSLVLSLTII